MPVMYPVSRKRTPKKSVLWPTKMKKKTVIKVNYHKELLQIKKLSTKTNVPKKQTCTNKERCITPDHMNNGSHTPSCPHLWWFEQNHKLQQWYGFLILYLSQMPTGPKGTQNLPNWARPGNNPLPHTFMAQEEEKHFTRRNWNSIIIQSNNTLKDPMGSPFLDT